jgi:hypothetical protein
MVVELDGCLIFYLLAGTYKSKKDRQHNGQNSVVDGEWNFLL